MIELTVPNDKAGLRLDRYLALTLPQFSRSRLQALIRAGEVQLEGKGARTRAIVRAGDVVRLTVPPLEEIAAEAEEIPLEILFEDEDLLVLNKPPGLVVHPGAGNQRHTLVNALLHHCASLSGIGGKERPGIIHRLDKDTSGCLVVATNDAAHHELARQFAEREVKKIYLALVAGTFKRVRGTIDAPIGRHPVQRKKMAVDRRRGRAAKTEYRVLQSGGGVSLVECGLHSGRTHQIRVHLHHLGHPIIGDALYGRKVGASRQMLHAWKLGFNHPRTKERLFFEAPLPADFRELQVSAFR
ncbi:MAG TPA: RluA family pseudouridine synthase [Chthoniobacterales bacterium]|jgi:23S rRNA pseudouridine1911/1915/1917 synthase|nr:RluA family pseudouridine synthase [Chthoniobacterales bacterium]